MSVRSEIHELRRQIDSEAKNIGFQIGQQSALLASQMDYLPSLGAASFKVTSQWGEDGILEWLVSHLPTLVPSFVEFGVGYYQEANTLFLLKHRNWRGLVADISAEAVAGIRSTELMWQRQLTAVQKEITRDNINSLFTENGFGGDIGILSIDIDGNDYWVWDAITVANPGIVICEYNGTFGDLYPITIPANDHFDRRAAHYSGLYWGASISALEHLANKKGYRLVGSNTEGCNAFFVRSDIAESITKRIGDTKARPFLYRGSRDKSGDRTFLDGVKRLDPISDVSVVNVITGETVRIGDLGNLYSDEWMRAMGNR